MTALTALIADDEPHLAEYLRQRLQALWPELQIVAVARNGLEAVAALHEHEPTVAFLDIKMPGLSGLEVAGAAQNCHCVFVTAYDQYAVAAFERDAVDYLLKPYSDERLSRTIQKLKDRLGSGQPALAGDLLEQLRQALSPNRPGTPARLSWIRAGNGHDVKLIAVDDVCYFQASDKYTSVVTGTGEYLIRTPLKELLEQLDPQRFWQVHRATVVNVSAIEEARRDFSGKVSLKLKARPELLMVSRAFSHLFRQM
ncbi:LytR/AlgR family response regulator transcription factor [Chitinimonas lacunae]|uniref:LytR/AlgR family response regulator transcription factor n=1 Tax=Chitinimonas lacunae TaxID=1963018 RepID=A0ABV8MVX5_9NEIS